MMNDASWVKASYLDAKERYEAELQRLNGFTLWVKIFRPFKWIEQKLEVDRALLDLKLFEGFAQELDRIKLLVHDG